MEKQDKCPVCGSTATKYQDHEHDSVFYECPTCGRYQVTLDAASIADDPRLAAYLFHNRFTCKGRSDYRYHTTLDKDLCDKYKEQFDKGVVVKHN